MNLVRQIILTCLAVYLSIGISYSSGKKEVTFKSDKLKLSGTLYFPKGDGPFPAVVFVHGSGPETKKNSNYSAKWFASIGYIALAYDKRGCGNSDGEKKDWSRFSFETLSDDVVAAVTFLSQMKEVDKTKIGLHASSQGGWVAPLAASKSDLISYMIIRSASVCTVGEDRVFERKERLKNEGFSEIDLKEARELQLKEPKNNSGNTTDDFTELFNKYKNKPWFSRVYGGNDPFSNTLVAYRRWYASIVNFDPVVYLKNSKIPVFWIFGDPEIDLLGPVSHSIQALNEHKKEGKPYEINSFRGEGHNISERKYELLLYNWLKKINEYDKFKFKKH